MQIQCWASIFDVGSTLRQHCVSLSCFLDRPFELQYLAPTPSQIVSCYPHCRNSAQMRHLATTYKYRGTSGPPHRIIDTDSRIVFIDSILCHSVNPQKWRIWLHFFLSWVQQRPLRGSHHTARDSTKEVMEDMEDISPVSQVSQATMATATVTLETMEWVHMAEDLGDMAQATKLPSMVNSKVRNSGEIIFIDGKFIVSEWIVFPALLSATYINQIIITVNYSSDDYYQQQMFPIDLSDTYHRIVLVITANH